MRSVAFAIAVVYAAAMPCPPAAEAGAEATAHAHHEAAASHHHEGEAAPPCHGAATAVWKAVCPCGCGSQAPLAGGAAALAWGIVSRAAPPLDVARPSARFASAALRTPRAPAHAIDHVPLPA